MLMPRLTLKGTTPIELGKGPSLLTLDVKVKHGAFVLTVKNRANGGRSEIWWLGVADVGDIQWSDLDECEQVIDALRRAMQAQAITEEEVDLKLTLTDASNTAWDVHRAVLELCGLSISYCARVSDDHPRPPHKISLELLRSLTRVHQAEIAKKQADAEYAAADAAAYKLEVSAGMHPSPAETIGDQICP